LAKAKQPVNINGIEFDALFDEERVLDAEAPDYPIEDGFSVSDTIILKPQMLSMTLFVSDTPVTWKKRGHGGAGWTEGVIARLEDLYFSKQTVTVVTSEKSYKSMAIQNISFAKSTDVGYARQIPITFKEIRVTSSKKTTIPDSYGKSGDTGANAGTASTSTGGAPAASSSTSSSASGSSSSSNGGITTKSSILFNLASAAGLF
jgi:hypothetical protein